MMQNELEFLRGLANCEGKEQMERYIREHKPKPMTNADRIRAMSDEELAEVLSVITSNDVCLNPACDRCSKCLLYDFCTNCRQGEEMDWLQQPVKDGADQ